MTQERAKEIIESIPDDVLIDFATTCSNYGLAMRAEIELAKRYPSKRAIAAAIRARGAK